MVSRKPRLQKVVVPIAKPEQPGADVPLVEQDDTQARERAAFGTWHALASQLLNRIRTANSTLDSRVAVPVTVIIPALLKDALDVDWLFEALESVINQTAACKCIIVENGSEFLPDMQGNISIIHSEKGLSKARNAGIKASGTEFFFPLDANDWLPEKAIETAVKRMPAKGFLYGSTMLFNHKRGDGDQHLYNAKPYDFSEIMKMVYFPNGALQRKADWEAIGGYRETLPFLEDWDYWMTAGEKGICGTPIQDVLYWYRQHGGIVGNNKHTPEWESTKKLIQSYHADIYKGVYPPMCCGNRTPITTPYTPPSKAMLMPGADGMVLIEYVGGNMGKMPWYGAVTKTRYVAGGTQRQLYIDARDAITESSKSPGFLEMTDHGAPIFKKVEA